MQYIPPMGSIAYEKQMITQPKLHSGHEHSISYLAFSGSPMKFFSNPITD